MLAGVGVTRMLNTRSLPEFPAYLQARVTTIVSDREAAVAGIEASEGDHVVPGTALMSLRDRSLEQRIAEQRQEVALLESQLQQATATAELELLVRSREIDEEVLWTELQASDFLREQFACELEHSMLADLMSDNSMAAIWNDSDPVFRSAMVTAHQQGTAHTQTALRLELMANSAEVLAAQVDLCERRRASLERVKSDLPAMVQETSGVLALETRIGEARTRLAELESEQLTLSTSSTAFGIVGLFRVGPGMVVEPGTPLVDILDDQTRYLVAHISSRHIAAFNKGDEVDLIFPGNQRRSGVVERIAPQAQIDTLDPRKSEDSIVLVDIAQSGRVWPTLPIGSQVQVLVRE
jgi:multidrug resistance efflux pump